MYLLFAYVIRFKGGYIMSATFFIRRREAARKAREAGKKAYSSPSIEEVEKPQEEAKKPARKTAKK